MAELVIRDEDEAWLRLQEILAGKRTVTAQDLELSDWPNLTISVKQGQAIITPRIMRSFIGLQDAVYRSQALVKYDSHDLRKLTEDEKDSTEFQVHVKAGSSVYDVNFQKILTELGNSAIDKMEPVHIVVIVLSAGLLWAGTSAWKMFLQHRLEMRKVEVGSEEKKQTLEHMKFTSAHETERQKILVSALRKSPKLQDIKDYADEAKLEMLNGVANTPIAEIAGIKVPGEIADELSKNARENSTTRTVTAVYKVLRVDTTSPDGFRVRLEDVRTGEEVTAHLIDAMLSEKERADIQHAEWSKTKIKCTLRQTVRGGRVAEAHVTHTDGNIGKTEEA